ncbi:MAG TPA: tetratricopeptide repeat protein [Myxococcota bacterium]|nr:tetratricopeptide repeat protein [Myxococcota bacterium]
MPWFGRKVYDRTRLLDQAMQATRRRRRKRAISYYREILAVDPNDAHVHRKVAPLFGHTKQLDDAWQSYRLAASQLTRQGFVDQAIGVYREASAFLTKDHRLWLALGELELERKRPVDAVNVLVEGARHLRSRRTQQEALTLLQRARKIQPHAFEPTYELANLLVRAGARDRARKLLQGLAPRVHGRQLRRLRRRLFVLSPTPANAWRWLASWFSR